MIFPVAVRRPNLVNSKKVIATAILLASLAGGAWWYFHADPEAEVRDAHQEFARLVSKSEDEGSNAMLLNAYVLQNKFANTCEVSGEAEMFAGSYTPEEMAGTIMRVRGMFRSVDLAFHELVIGFPAADEAIVNFIARITVQYRTEGVADVIEVREVASRMRKIEGDWRFVSFRLAKVSESSRLRP